MFNANGQRLELTAKDQEAVGAAVGQRGLLRVIGDLDAEVDDDLGHERSPFASG